MTNIALATEVIQNLISMGVEDFCLCAGARNSPFMYLFEENQDALKRNHIRLHHFFEERSAGFFSIGLSAAKNKPVAVITTSGTAVAELLPAVIEAEYSGHPLIVISADRPKSYRGTGAPQSIEQVGIFSSYVEKLFDLGLNHDAASAAGIRSLDDEHLSWQNELQSWKKKRPIHINVCLSEPLIDAPLAKIDLNTKFKKQEFNSVSKSEFASHEKALGSLQEFLSSNKPLVILGALAKQDSDLVLQFLKKLKLPVYAEAMSNLRHHPEIQSFEIYGGDKSIQALIQGNQVNSVLRIGGIPTIRLWRDLEDKLLSWPVFSISHLRYTGLARSSLHFSNMEVLSEATKALNNEFEHAGASWKAERDDVHWELYQSASKTFPLAEPSLIAQLSECIQNDPIYLGNSLPIREWDFIAKATPSEVFGNRGANGIDGQISTYFGWAKGKKQSWCIVGDLTALYDLASFWIPVQEQDLESVSDQKHRIVVINNGGGQIFRRMFGKDIFINRHEIEFSHWAKMFGLDYYCPQFDELKSGSWKKSSLLQDSKNLVIELKPQLSATDDFWKFLSKESGSRS